MSDEAKFGVELLVVTFGAGWFAGYGWALYRAIGWEKRIRAWADKVVTRNEAETVEREAA